MPEPKMPDSLAAALAELQKQLPPIKKAETAEVQTQKGSYSYTYANLAGISAEIMPLLGRFGLSFIAKPTFDGDRFVLSYSLLHISGQRENGQYPLPTTGTPQAIGSAITYGRRYCLCAVTGIAPEDDDDGATAEAEALANRGTVQRATRHRQSEPRSQEGTQVQRRGSKPPPLPSDAPVDPNAITAAQLAKLAIQVKELGLDKDRDAYLARLEEITGQRVETSKALTKAAASRAIEAFDQELAAAAAQTELPDAFPEEGKP